MKFLKPIFFAVALLWGAAAYSQSNTSSADKGQVGALIGNMLKGVFTKTDLQVSDLVGRYESVGPAVAFKGEGFLKKAGGIAGAAALKAKLQPYYEQYGLTGMPFEVDTAGNFSMSVNRIRISGTLERNDDNGTFVFRVKAAGMTLGRFTAYIEKSGKDLNLMFDATKLKQLITTVAGMSGLTIAKTLATLLESYDGACIGFEMKCVSGGSAYPVNSTEKSDTAAPAKSGVDMLRDILNRRR